MQIIFDYYYKDVTGASYKFEILKNMKQFISQEDQIKRFLAYYLHFMCTNQFVHHDQGTFRSKSSALMV